MAQDTTVLSAIQIHKSQSYPKSASILKQKTGDGKESSRDMVKT